MEQEPPDRKIPFNVAVLDSILLPLDVAVVFSLAMAEAQLLEDALKTAIRLDAHAFVDPADIPDVLAELSTITLGGTLKIANGTATRTATQQALSRMTGFAQLIPMVSGLSPDIVATKLKDALRRRNEIAHRYLVDVIRGTIPAETATHFLNESRLLFDELKQAVVLADAFSSKAGAIAQDGSSLPRVPRL